MITQEQREKLDELECQVASAIKHPVWYSLADRYNLVDSFVTALLNAGLELEEINVYLNKLEKYVKYERDALESRLKAFKDLLK